MSAREVEGKMLLRCASVARSASDCAQDQREANVFRVAAMIMRSRLPAESARLMQASERYFAIQPDDRLPAAEVVRQGWIINLPRLRDMLSRQLGCG